MAFLNRLAKVAEREGHHPDFWLKRWNQVSLSLRTHAIAGLLSRNGFVLAAKLQTVVSHRPPAEYTRGRPPPRVGPARTAPPTTGATPLEAVLFPGAAEGLAASGCTTLAWMLRVTALRDRILIGMWNQRAPSGLCCLDTLSSGRRREHALLRVLPSPRRKAHNGRRSGQPYATHDRAAPVGAQGA